MKASKFFAGKIIAFIGMLAGIIVVIVGVAHEKGANPGHILIGGALALVCGIMLFSRT